jgi:hypothetical protein
MKNGTNRRLRYAREERRRCMNDALLRCFFVESRCVCSMQMADDTLRRVVVVVGINLLHKRSEWVCRYRTVSPGAGICPPVKSGNSGWRAKFRNLSHRVELLRHDVSKRGLAPTFKKMCKVSVWNMYRCTPQRSTKYLPSMLNQLSSYRRTLGGTSR